MNVCDIITNKLLTRHIIEETEVDVCTFGLKLIFSDAINILLIIIIGYFFDSLLYSLIYILTFSGIRKFSGGFHAKTFRACRLSMIGIFVVTLILVKILAGNAIWISVSCIVFTMTTMIICAPIIHPNRKLTTYEIKANKLIAILLSSICSVIAIVLLIFKYSVGLYLSLVLFAITILMYVGKFANSKSNI